MAGIDLPINLSNVQAAIDRLSIIRNKMQMIADDIRKANEHMTRLNTRIKDQERLLKRVLVDQGRGSAEYKKQDRILTGLKTKLDSTAKSVRNLTQQQSQLGLAYNKAGISAQKTNAQIQATGVMARTASTLVSQLRFALMGTFGAFAVIQAIRNLAGEAIKFEDALKGVEVVSGATAKEMETLRRAALDLAASGIFSPSEIAETQIRLAKLGFTASEIAKMIKSIGEISIVTGEDLEKSTNLMATTLKSFGLDASQTERIANQMAYAFNKSALGVENMFEAMKYVGPVARKMGWDFAEVSSLLGIMSDNMISGSLAGTSLRNIMLQLADSNSKLYKNLNMSGTSFDEFIEKIKVMEKVSVTAGLETVELRRAITAFFAVAQNTDDIKKFREEMENLDGILEKLAEERLQTIGMQAKRVSASFGALGASVADTGGWVKELLKGLADTIGMLAKIQAMGEDNPGGFIRALLGGPSAMAGMVRILAEATAKQELQAFYNKQFTKDIEKQVDALRDKIQAIGDEEERLRFLENIYSSISAAIQAIRNTPSIGNIGIDSAELTRLLALLAEVEKRIKAITGEDDPDQTAEQRKKKLRFAEQIEVEAAKLKYYGIELERQLENIRNKYQRKYNDLLTMDEGYTEAVELERLRHKNNLIAIKEKETAEIAKLEYALAALLGDANITDPEKRELELEYLLNIHNKNNINLIGDTKQRNLELQAEEVRHSIAISKIKKEYSEKEKKEQKDLDKWMVSDLTSTNDEIYLLKKNELKNEIETNRQLLEANKAGQEEIKKAKIEGQKSLIQLDIEYHKKKIAIARLNPEFGENIKLLEQKIRELELMLAALGVEIPDSVSKNTDKKIDILLGGLSTIASAASSYADSIVEALDRVVGRYDRMIDDIQSALDRETQLRADGYANNVDAKEKELARIQALRQKALKDQEGYIRQQQIIEGVVQALNITTAISSILKDAFKIGPLGALLASGAIAGLFTLWTTAKQKAIESSYTYGEGGKVDGYVQGNSHQRGGKWINVEGDEFVTKKSRVTPNTLPILEAINEGRLDLEYIGNIGKSPVVVNFDEGKTIKSIHSLLSKMSKGSKEVSYLGGVRIERSGSRTRRIYAN